MDRVSRAKFYCSHCEQVNSRVRFFCSCGAAKIIVIGIFRTYVYIVLYHIINPSAKPTLHEQQHARCQPRSGMA